MYVCIHVWVTQLRDRVILPKALYAAALLDTTSKVSITQYITFILGAYFNPPGEAVHKIINIPPITLLYTKKRLHIMRGLAKYGYTNIISSPHKSTVTNNFLSNFKNVVDRHTQVMTFGPKTYLKASLTRQSKVIGKRGGNHKYNKVFVHTDCFHHYPQPILSTTQFLWISAEKH